MEADRKISDSLQYNDCYDGNMQRVIHRGGRAPEMGKEKWVI